MGKSIFVEIYKLSRVCLTPFLALVSLRLTTLMNSETKTQIIKLMFLNHHNKPTASN